MIGQILPRGSSVRGLLYYLFTEGAVGEKGLDAAHTDPRVIAGWDNGDDLAGLQPPLTTGGRRDFSTLPPWGTSASAAVGKSTMPRIASICRVSGL